MKKSILEIYALAVCFLGIISIVVSLGIGIYNIVEIIYPEFAVDQWQYEQHSSNDKFWQNHPKRYPPELNGKALQKPSEEELTKMRTESYDLVIKNQQRNSIQSLVQSLIFLIISSIFFVLHWKLFRKSQKQPLS